MRWVLPVLVWVVASALPGRAAGAQGGACPPAPAGGYVILLHGFNSSSLVDDATGGPNPANHRVRDDFRALRDALSQGLTPPAEVIHFSYGAARQLAQGAPPEMAWATATYRGESEPRYAARDTTDLPLAAHAAALGWLVRDVLRCDPAAVVQVVGFSLGGAVAVRWVAGEPEGPDSPLRAVRRVVLLDSPLGGINVALLRQAVQLFPAAATLLGDGTAVRELAAAGELLAATREAARRVDVVAVESGSDLVVNGTALVGGAWLGRGIGASGGPLGTELELRQVEVPTAVPPGASLYERVLLLHQAPLREPAVLAAIVEALRQDGPRWQARRAAQSLPTEQDRPTAPTPDSRVRAE